MTSFRSEVEPLLKDYPVTLHLSPVLLEFLVKTLFYDKESVKFPTQYFVIVETNYWKIAWHL